MFFLVEIMKDRLANFFNPSFRMNHFYRKNLTLPSKAMDPKYIDNEEKELMEAFENANNPESFKPSEEDQKKFKTAAKEFITSEKKMNIRIDPYELEKIKERAAREIKQSFLL
jgi:predicted DNA binding CopG/RHH family protein